VSLSLPDWTLLAIAGGAVAFLVTAIWTVVYFAPIVTQNLQRPPLFQPPRLGPVPGGEEMGFTTEDGLELIGSYFKAPGPRAGVVVFCPEFLSDRWSFLPYSQPLLEAGYDIFTFDFRNHGESQAEPDYEPLPWISDREAIDLRAALAKILARPDADPAGVAFFGVSRGGSTALCVAADEPRVWAVITDGAFPTRGTLRAYMYRWAEVYLPWKWTARYLPMWVVDIVWFFSHHQSQNRLNRRFLDVEGAVARLRPRPWLMIHGERDNYIAPAIALELFERAGEHKESWIVPGARHNRCREVAPELYVRRVLDFLARHGPRSLPTTDVEAGSVVPGLLPEPQPSPAS
jgi:pimeloyl-ACP methyl ester carboxylesterase